MTPEDTVFYSLLIGFLSTSLTLVVKAILKSGCSRVDCLCFKCVRDPTPVGETDIELGSTPDLMSTTGPIHVNVDPKK